MANPTDERQLDLVRRNMARIRQHALEASDAIYAPGAECPEPWRGYLLTYIADISTLSDVEALNPKPDSTARFWARITRPESSAIGLLAPCWRSSHARLKRPDGTLGISVVHWRGKMRPASHVAFELLRSRELQPDERLKRLCDTLECVNVDQHYRLEAKRSRRARLAIPEPLMETLGQASEDIPLCRNGHHLKPGTIPNNCSKCRIERRKATQAKKAAAWRATYYGEIETPRPTPPIASGTDATLDPVFVPDNAAGLPSSESRPPLEIESLDDIDAAIRAMFTPTPVSERILAIHERSKLGG